MSDDQEKIKGREGKKASNNRSEGETDTKSSVSESGHASSKQDEPQESSVSESGHASSKQDEPQEIKFECEDCKTDFSIYKDREHRKIAQDGGENVLLGDVGEFCEAFYHVPDKLLKYKEEFCRAFGNVSNFSCLDEQTCAIAIRSHYATPLTAVALVKYEQWEQESSKWAIKSVRRYTNCFGKKMHAENFFYCDIKEASIHQGEAGFLNFWNGKKWRITMYLTMQPCHLSTTKTGGTKEDQSCCKVMIDAKDLLGENVEIVIKPTHLCKAGWEKKDVEKLKEEKKGLKEKKEIELIDEQIKKQEDFNTRIDNAEKGVKMLIEEGIELECMKIYDWNFLLQYIQHSKREGEDKKIGKFLKAQAQAHAQAKSLDHLNQLMKSSSVKE